MGSLFRDLRYGIRALAKSPNFSIAAVLALALGIGATTQSFSVVNTVLIKPLPYKDSERLVAIWKKTLTQEREFVSPADFLDWRRMSQSFENVAASRGWAVNVTENGEPEHVRGYQVSANFFDMLGMQASLGRTFRSDEDQAGKERVVVLSHRFWNRRFGGQPSVINKEIILNNEKYLIIGVMPDDCRYPRGAAQLWAPMVLTPAQATDRKDNSLLVTARIRSGASFGQAEADIAGVARRIEELYRDTNAGHGAWLLPVRDLILGPAEQDLMTALVATFLVLLIACANVANMLFAKGAAMQKEVAIRIAIGSNRFRLIRQFLIEGLVLALVGGVLGILLANWGLKLFVSNIPTFISDVNPRMLDIKIDSSVVIFTVCLSFLTVLIFGLSPALLASKPDINSALKDGGRDAAGSVGRHRTRSVLVVIEVALAVILLISAGLLFRGYMQVISVNPGFNPQNVVTMEIPLVKSKYSEGHRVATFYQQVLKKIENIPNVQSAGAITDLPLAGGDNLKELTVEGQPAPPRGQEYLAHHRVISPNYFQAQGVSFIRGEDFSDKDFESKLPVAIISDSTARKFLGPGDALGKQVTIEGESTPRRIIGVVRDVIDWDLLNKSSFYVYVPYLLDNPERSMAIVVRSNSNPSSLIPAVRAKIMEIDPNQPVTNVKTMEKVVADTRAPQRINMVGLIILASISTILAAIGIYGLISYSVEQRTQEIGIRMALGASPGEILRFISKQGLLFTSIGLGAGLIGAFFLTKGLAGLIYGISLMDPLTYLSVPLFMILIGMLATYIPARRASKVDPMVALRCK